MIALSHEIQAGKQEDYWTESYFPAQFFHAEDHVKARGKYL